MWAGYWCWQKGTVWLLDLTYARQKPWHCPLMMKLCWRKRSMPPTYDHKIRNEANTYFLSAPTKISKDAPNNVQVN